jgi:hypothetical protein
VILFDLYLERLNPGIFLSTLKVTLDPSGESSQWPIHVLNPKVVSVTMKKDQRNLVPPTRSVQPNATVTASSIAFVHRKMLFLPQDARDFPVKLFSSVNKETQDTMVRRFPWG